MRPIIVQFAYLEDKKSVYGNKKKLKGKGMVIREDLTQEKVKILKLCMQFQKLCNWQFKYKVTRTINSRIKNTDNGTFL